MLNFLTDKALEASGHVWRRPVYAAEDAAEEAEPVDDCDMADIVDEAEVEEEEEQDFAEINKVTSFVPPTPYRDFTRRFLSCRW